MNSAREKKSGFTLLETLVAAAILSIVAVMVFGAFSGVMRASAGVNQRADITHTARFIARKLTEDINSASLLPHNEYGIFIGLERKIRTSQVDEIRFTNFGRSTLFTNAGSDQAEVAWFVISGKEPDMFILLRRENPFIMGEKPDEKRADLFEVTDRLRTIKVRYYVGATWVESFDSTTNKGLPKAVSVEFTLEDEDGHRITKRVIASAGGAL
ncbi:hypothetical protein MNBD_NITROSPINAE02-1580 [hydrothermal vent metagenome]|uniref:Type II secretion system protein J n=1 Tax=hydrothermal vent metagenome TaxID=652676 RepID=A0A3B1BXK6_9ZZZZ